MKEPLGFEIGGKARSIEALIHQSSENAPAAAADSLKIINIAKVGG